MDGKGDCGVVLDSQGWRHFFIKRTDDLSTKMHNLPILDQVRADTPNPLSQVMIAFISAMASVIRGAMIIPMRAKANRV